MYECIPKGVIVSTSFHDFPTLCHVDLRHLSNIARLKMNLIKHSNKFCHFRVLWSTKKLSPQPFREASSTPIIPASTLPRVVILGCGWGGYRLAKDLDKSKYEVVVVSPRNHFLFTPLLPSTTTGTLEFRSVQEPVRTIKDVVYYQSRAEAVDYEKKQICCQAVHVQHQKDVVRFDLPYDKLVIAVGSKSATFNVPGFESREEYISTEPSASASSPLPPSKTLGSETGTDHHNVFFLKQLQHARAIRNRILECFERASNPLVDPSERKRLLTFVVVGGGPTSVEFTSELHDFLDQDVVKWYKDLANDVRVIIVEASENLLGSFDASLQSYVKRKLETRRIEVMICSTVQRVCAESVLLEQKSAKKKGDASEEYDSTIFTLPFGICVWATGNQALDFVRSLGLPTLTSGPGRGRIMIDDHLRVDDDSIPFHRVIFALGDCAANKDNPLGLLAQVANQQGKYLAAYLNSGHQDYRPFRYTFMGSMAQLGTWDAIVDGPNAEMPKLKGFMAFLAWRSAYWTYSVSVTNKILILMYWFKAYWFGRDISKF